MTKTLKNYAPLTLLLAIIGWFASLALVIDKVRLLEDPTYTPSCSINPVLACGSVINTDPASLLGFPNPILGVAGFAAAGMFALALATQWRPPAWMWAVYTAASTTAVLFLHWLIYQSLVVIGALCPYCMVVWAVTVPLWWWTVLKTLLAFAPENPTVRYIVRFPLLPVAFWFAVLAAAIFLRWQDYWLTSLGL